MSISLGQLRRDIESGRLDPRRVIEEHRHRAATIGPRLNAFVELTDEGVGNDGPLRGVPIALKDAFVDRDRVPTMGSRVHPRGLGGTATICERLRGAGATILGYTNLHEWAIGTTSTITATGPIRNPWDPARQAGGSSGGSAAAVAAGLVPAAIGTDAGGSVRIPAASCGVVGLKPTFGAIPLDGEVGAFNPINHGGVMARSVDDVAVLFKILAQRRVEEVELSPLRVGVPDAFFFDDIQPAVRAVVDAAIDLVGDRTSVRLAGVEASSDVVSKLQLPYMAKAVATELSDRPDDFDPWTLKALLRGRDMGLTDVDLAPFRAPWDAAFESCDVIAVPTLPSVPPPIEDHKYELPSGPAVVDVAQYALNAPMNTGGIPALAVPCGEVDSMAVSVTLVAPRDAEDVLFAAGRLLEDALDRAYVGRVATIG